MAKVLGRSLFFVVLVVCARPAFAADPMVMILMSIAKELTADLNTTPPAPVETPPAVEFPAFYPGTSVEVALVRRLVNDGFAYLSESRRREVFEALHAELMKPENFAVRAPVIEHFAVRAVQMRSALQRLAQLSTEQKEFLVGEFRKEAKSLSEADLGTMRDALERGLLPVPDELNRLFLAALSE